MGFLVEVPVSRELRNGETAVISELVVTVDGPEDVSPQVLDKPKKGLCVAFNSSSPGTYCISVKQGGVSLRNCPMKVNVSAKQKKKTPSGTKDSPGTRRKQRVRFEVDAKAKSGEVLSEDAKLECTAEGPEAVEVDCKRNGGKLVISFLATELKGTFKVSVMNDGEHIHRSPFPIQLGGSAPSDKKGAAHIQTRTIKVSVEAKDRSGNPLPEDAKLTANATGPEEVTVALNREGKHIKLAFKVSQIKGSYRINVLHNEDPIHRSPFAVRLSQEPKKEAKDEEKTENKEEKKSPKGSEPSSEDGGDKDSEKEPPSQDGTEEKEGVSQEGEEEKEEELSEEEVQMRFMEEDPDTIHDREKEDKENVWEAIARPGGIVYRSEGKGVERSKFNIKLATLNRLTEYLTRPHRSKEDKPQDEKFLNVFLTTYQSFTTPTELFDKLLERHKTPPEYEEKYPEETKLMKKAVYHVLRAWFSNYYRDFKSELTTRLKDFGSEQVANSTDDLKAQARFLQKAVLRKLERGTYTSMFGSGKVVVNPPASILPKKDWRQVQFMELDSLEIARQMTIGDHHLYAETQPVELLKLAWSKPKYQHLAPNVIELTTRFNKFSNATATMIVTTQQIKQRKKLVTKLLDVMKHLREMGNFNSWMAILSGMNSSACYRLKHTFAELDKKHKEMWAAYQAEADPARSYKVLRESYDNVSPPAIPFLGVYLTDLTFVEDGNPDEVNGLINFFKRTLVYEIIEQVLRYQKYSYNWKLVPSFQTYLNRLPNQSEEELYQSSLLCEPKKCARKQLK